MFSNKKCRGYLCTIAVILFAAQILLAFVLFIYGASEDVEMGINIALYSLGSAFVVPPFVFGFGELIQNIQKIKEKLYGETNT